MMTDWAISSYEKRYGFYNNLKPLSVRVLAHLIVFFQSTIIFYLKTLTKYLRSIRLDINGISKVFLG